MPNNGGGCGGDDGSGSGGEDGPEFGPEPDPRLHQLPWKNIPSELVLKILQYLPRSDLLSSRLVSKDFVPRRIRVAVWFFEHSKHLMVGLNLQTKRTDYESGIEFDIGKNRHGELDKLAPGFLQRHQFGYDTSLDVVPDSLLEKIRFLTVAIGQPNLVLGDTFDDLAIVQAKAHNLFSICGINTEFGNFNWMSDIISRNKGLNRICLVKADLAEEPGDIYDNMHYVDCNWVTDFQNLRDLTIMNYGLENPAKLPANLNHLVLLSPVALENVVWMSENEQELRNFGIAVHEEVADETFLRHMTQIGKPWNAFELLGINDQFGLPLDSHVTKGAILTPELVRRFIHLPHVENLLFDFVLILSPDHPDDQDKNEEFLTEQIHRLKDRFHHLNTVCNKTPGIMEARFVDIIEPQEGSFGYSITISIDRQTFNGLLP